MSESARFSMSGQISSGGEGGGLPGSPYVSVVIPTYNRCSLIGRAIETVLSQSVSPAEIIVVDDGSTDETRAAVARCGSRVRYIHQENAGASEARNCGVNAASAEWIAFLDSDDVWRVGHLESLARVISETKGVADLYFCDMMMEGQDGGGSLWEHCGFRVEGDSQLVADGREWVMMERQPMMLQTSIVRRNRYLQLGGLSTSLRTRHDTHFFIRLGIGRSLCAVAGIGAEQTSADHPGNRLMSAAGPGSIGFWNESVLMYRDLLAHCEGLTANERRTLRGRLAETHWRIFRMVWEDRRVAEGLPSLMRSLGADPRVPWKAVFRRLRG